MKGMACNEKKNSNDRRYSHLDKSERICIEKGLRNRLSLRQIAQSLNRSASAISYEVKNNRVFDKDPTRSVIHNAQDITCEKLNSWPWVCTGCKYLIFDYEKDMKFRPSTIDGEIASLLSNDLRFNNFLIKWNEMRKKHYNDEITDKEFEDWKLSYPKKSRFLK